MDRPSYLFIEFKETLFAKKQVDHVSVKITGLVLAVIRLFAKKTVKVKLTKNNQVQG